MLKNGGFRNLIEAAKSWVWEMEAGGKWARCPSAALHWQAQPDCVRCVHATELHTGHDKKQATLGKKQQAGKKQATTDDGSASHANHPNDSF
jgi:hypothetical protein